MCGTILGFVTSFISPGFMGYAPEMYVLISDHEVKDTDDDQLYYTKLYLDQDVRVRCEFSIILLFFDAYYHRNG